MRDIKIDMLKGPILKNILLFAIPMILSFFLQQFYNIADTFIAGKFIGSHALAATGTAGSVTFFILSLTTGITNAYSILISQYFGANDDLSICKTIVNAVYLSILVGLIISVVVLIGARTLLTLINTPNDIINACTQYLQIYIGGGCVAGLLYNAGSAFLRSMGDSKSPFIILIVSSVVNILLDIIFIIIFKLGISGLALATVLAKLISAVFCVYYIMLRYPQYIKHTFWSHFDLKNIILILKLGIPHGIQMILVSFGDMYITGVVNTFGTYIVASYVTSLRVQNVTTGVFNSFASAFSVFAGQNLGADKIDRIKKGFYKIFIVVLFLSLFSSGIIYGFGRSFVNLFISKSDTNYITIVTLVCKCIRLSAIFYPFLALIWLYNATLRGLGDIITPFVSSLVEIITKIGLSMYMEHHFGFLGVWMVCPIGWILGIIPSSIRFHRGNWVKLSLKKEISK